MVLNKSPETIDPSQQPWRLITLPISHYCEKVRWGLDRLGIPYQEEAHLLPFHRKVTEPLGGTSVPVLVTPDNCLMDSAEILRFLDQFAPDALKLYSEDSGLQQEIEQLETVFNQTLGPAARQWGYYYILQHPEILEALWCQNIPKKERAVYPRMAPKLKTLVTEALEISSNSAEVALENIDQIFEQVEQYLSSGQAFLMGDRMTAADLTLASLAAPILFPKEHPMLAPHELKLPREMTREVVALRKRPAGEFILRMYRNSR